MTVFHQSAISFFGGAAFKLRQPPKRLKPMNSMTNPDNEQI